MLLIIRIDRVWGINRAMKQSIETRNPQESDRKIGVLIIRIGFGGILYCNNNNSNNNKRSPPPIVLVIIWAPTVVVQAPTSNPKNGIFLTVEAGVIGFAAVLFANRERERETEKQEGERTLCGPL